MARNKKMGISAKYAKKDDAPLESAKHEVNEMIESAARFVVTTRNEIYPKLMYAYKYACTTARIVTFLSKCAIFIYVIMYLAGMINDNDSLEEQPKFIEPEPEPSIMSSKPNSPSHSAILAGKDNYIHAAGPGSILSGKDNFIYSGNR